ncbi:uncharacterized protein LOC113332795 [Papaver somniferum]|uniref:uncharacterized protein LOC113332795 n=1 Tax=Papaver somniferum TaxID=3469 RepID=UPI000E6F7318|nr:uncharacterized protein LOC113332795 [Papaver somniferum]
MKATRWTHDYDSHILQFFKLGNKGSKLTTIRECVWLLPPRGVILFCFNGTALGDPGLAGFGTISRDHDGAVIGTISGGLGIASSYIAKSFSVIWAIEWANKLKCDKIIIRADLNSVVTDFQKGTVPWCFKTRWIKAKSSLSQLCYELCYKETNFSSDSLSKRGAQMQMGQVEHHIGKPAHLITIEMPNRKYYRIC